MPSVSRERIADVRDYGVVEDRTEDVDGTTIEFITVREEIDSAPMLRGLPDDQCSCPHWGYVFSGRLTFEVGDRREVFHAGDAFVVPAGHVPIFEPGTEYLQFSPTAELAVVEETILRNLEALETA